MDKYFVEYKIYEKGDDDYYPIREIKYNIDNPVDSVYGLGKIDKFNRGGTISIYKGDINKPKEAKLIKKIAFVDEKVSIRDFGDQPNKDGKRVYWAWISPQWDTMLRYDETVEIVDWNFYEENYDRLHAEYLANHTDDGEGTRKQDEAE